MVVISLPRARYSTLQVAASSELPNGLHFEFVFASTTNLALDRKFHRVMAVVQRFILNSEAYLNDQFLLMYRPPVQGMCFIIVYLPVYISFSRSSAP